MTKSCGVTCFFGLWFCLVCTFSPFFFPLWQPISRKLPYWNCLFTVCHCCTQVCKKSYLIPFNVHSSIQEKNGNPISSSVSERIISISLTTYFRTKLFNPTLTCRKLYPVVADVCPMLLPTTKKHIAEL